MTQNADKAKVRRWFARDPDRFLPTAQVAVVLASDYDEECRLHRFALNAIKCHAELREMIEKERDALLASRDAMARDAARWRFVNQIDGPCELHIPDSDGDGSSIYPDPDDANEAIDEAIARFAMRPDGKGAGS